MAANSGAAPRSIQRLTVVLLGGILTITLALGTLGVASGGIPPWVIGAVIAAVLATGLVGLYLPEVNDRFR